MHPRVIAKRQSDAYIRVKEAASRVASLAGIDAPDLAAIREKSPDVQRVKEFEAFADFMERLAGAFSQVDDLPSLDDMTVADIQGLDGFTAEQWERLISQETLGKQRATALAFMQGKLEAANAQAT